MRGSASLEPKEMVEAPVPYGVGTACDAQGFGVVVGDYDEARDAYFGDLLFITVQLEPDLAEAVRESSSRPRRIQTDDVEPTPRRSLRTLR